MKFLVFQIVEFGKFLEFSKLEIFGTFQFGSFWNFANCKFLESSKLIKINKFPDFFNF